MHTPEDINHELAGLTRQFNNIAVLAAGRAARLLAGGASTRPRTARLYAYTHVLVM